jgi:hypothetical protein
MPVFWPILAEKSTKMCAPMAQKKSLDDFWPSHPGASSRKVDTSIAAHVVARNIYKGPVDLRPGRYTPGRYRPKGPVDLRPGDIGPGYINAR